MGGKYRRPGEGQIRQRADGRWEARLRVRNPVTGLAKRESIYGATEQAVRRKLQEMQRRVDDGEPARDTSVRLDAFLDYWLETVRAHRKPSTHRSYTFAVARIKDSRIGRARLRDLTAVAIQDAIIPRKPTRSDALALAALKRALVQAVKWRFLTKNPAEGVAMPRIAKRDIHPMDAAQAQAFLAAARGDRHYAMYRLALDTGMREGELFGLRKTDVDFARGVVQIRRTFEHNTRTTGAPKTRAAVRDLEVGAETLAALRAHIEQLAARHIRSPLVFPSDVGTELHVSNFHRNSFNKVKAAIGLPDLRFHDLRHTAATLWLHAGMNPKVVSERLGHASVRTTLDLYGHALPSAHRELAGFLDNLLGTSAS